MGENAEPPKTVMFKQSRVRYASVYMKKLKKTSTLLAGSTRVLRRVTRQGGLTRFDYCFHVNAYKHLTAKGFTRRGDSTRARIKMP